MCKLHVALPSQVRCAIYTRKSTSEGLDQEFNSLDAQREAAEAFIASQARQGWVSLPTRPLAWFCCPLEHPTAEPPQMLRTFTRAIRKGTVSEVGQRHLLPGSPRRASTRRNSRTACLNLREADLIE